MTTPLAQQAPVPQVFPPTLREVLLRPRWLAMLALCLVVAGVFAWLGQWQLGRAIDTTPVDPGATEQVQPIDDIVKPGAYLNDPLVGQQASVSGSWIPGDFIVISSRFNDGAKGYWVTGQLRVAHTSTPTSLAVAVGWTADRAQADAAASALSDAAAADPTVVVDLTGRLISDEGPKLPDKSGDPLEQTRMSPAALLSRWHDTAELDVYRPFMTAAQPLGGLETIASPAPSQGSGVNWLNLFYAVEWAVFAGFAFYLWYRLGKDAWEREVEDIEDAAAELS
ncbi:MAG: SURF1 family protein [Actinobacteria bacterium]|nr:SURF1 family protein [Actinomycetota bacterium]